MIGLAARVSARTSLTFARRILVLCPPDGVRTACVVQDARSEPKLVMELGQGQCTSLALFSLERAHSDLLGSLCVREDFGERALLTNEPRAANVIACSERPLKLLYISKEAFEEVCRL